MSLLCDHCGYRTNEIKGGGPIPERGTRITLYVTQPEDLSREVLKSASAGIKIPELDFELEEGGLDGLYTTVEGLLRKMADRLGMANPFLTGDSASRGPRQGKMDPEPGGGTVEPSPVPGRFQSFLNDLNGFSNGEQLPFTMIITDPLSNSFVSPRSRDRAELELQAEQEGSKLCYERFVDASLDVEAFVRSEAQNERLGLNDLRVEGYEPRAVQHCADRRTSMDRPRVNSPRGRNLQPDHPRPIDPPGEQG